MTLFPALNYFSHSNTAEVEAAVQRERGGQEAKVTEGSPGGEDDPVMLLSRNQSCFQLFITVERIFILDLE